MKLEFNIFSLVIQNNSTFLMTSPRRRLSLKHLPVSRHGFRIKSDVFSCLYSSKKGDITDISRANIFRVFLHFLPFSFSQKFGYFVFRYSREHFRHFLEFIHSRLASVARLPCLYLETGCDLSNRKRFPCLHSLIETREGLGEFETDRRRSRGFA